MKKSFFLSISFFYLLITSCQKSNEDLLIEKSSIKNENAMMALSSPTSVSSGMKNYESYFISKIDGKIHGYIISTPMDYDPSNLKKYPLLLFMHGLGEKPNYVDYDFAKLKQHGPHREIFYKKRAFPAIVASFQLSKYEGEFNPHVVKEFIDVLTGTTQVTASSIGEVGYGKYNIDINKIHLTGLSLGGNGVYKTAFSYPNMFASLSTFAGYTGSATDMSKIRRPTYIRHNAADNVVGVSNAYNAQTWINAATPTEPVNFKIFDYSGHDSWGIEYGRTDLGNVYDWHFSKSLSGTVLSAPLISTSSILTSTGSLSISELFPANNSNVPANRYSRLTFKFNTNIFKGSGSIEIKNITDNTVCKVNSDWGMVSTSGNTVSIYPITLLDGKKYVVNIAKGAFKDSSGTPYEGINDGITWSFTAGNYTEYTATINTTQNASQIFQPTNFYPLHNSLINRPSNGYIDLILDFNKNVVKGSGTIKIENLTDKTSASINANWGMVSVNGTKAKLYPISVQSGKKYAVTIAGNAFKDESGIFYTGISNTYTWVFEVK